MGGITADGPGEFKATLRYTMDDGGHSVSDTSAKFTFIDFYIDTPNDDPTTTAGANSTNERVYNDAATNPTVTVPCVAKGTGATSYPGDLRWTIESIGSIKAKWEPHLPTNEYIGVGSSPTATFTGLPTNYEDFGPKKITLKMDGVAGTDTQVVEIFYLRDESNNPDGSVPNWFYYWNQVRDNDSVTYDGSRYMWGWTVGMSQWSYTEEVDKTTIWIGSKHPDDGIAYGCSDEYSGIDLFIASVVHEEEHVKQQARADSEWAPDDEGSWQYGWSFAKLFHNHWNKGSDNQWGKANYDDDNNGTIDDAAEEPPFEPGMGTLANGDPADVNLSHATYRDWHKDEELPDPLGYPADVFESEAVNAMDDAMNNNDYAGHDWGAPGKMFREINEYDDELY